MSLPLGFVVAANLRRRHLNETQRAMVAAKLANMPRGGDRSKASIEALVSQSDAAELLSVSRPSVQRAREALDHGAANLRGRHLNETQRSMVAAKLATLPKGRHASIEAPSQEDAAELLSISRPSVQRAREVLDHGAANVIAARMLA